ncbi:MAG: T9SS type A sorting domain-containing protein [Chitinophagales bacterium]|nr:T9SS type A sorting domain-containing protein [Chitinophagales bacterium]
MQDIIEVVDSNVWNADNFSSSCSAAHNAARNSYMGNNDAINVYFMQSNCDYEKKVLLNSNINCSSPNWVQNGTACANYPSTTLSETLSALMGGSSFSTYMGKHNGYYCTLYPSDCCPLECPSSWDTDVRGYSHELGHNLGLGHANDCYESIMKQSGDAPSNYLYDNQIGKIHKMFSVTNLRYTLTEPCFYDSNDIYIIDNNTEWNQDIQLYSDIQIMQGASLKITCKLRMPDNSKIIVEPGGKLIIDRGTITSACHGLWQGIEVWGNSSQHQYTYSGNQLYQGFVELKNGAVIENAATAIFLGKPDGIKDEKLMKYLSEKVKPLPEWMIELLRNGSNQTTPRTFLETAISNTKAQRDRTITYLVQDMISKQQENEEIDHPQLRSWLAAYQTPHGDYQIVDDYFETGNYSAALSILSTIPTVYSLNEKEAEEFTGLQSLFNVLSTVHSTNRNIFLLNENERSAIQNLADNGEGIAKVRACNILSFVYGTECNYNLKLPEANHFFKTDNAPAGKDNPLLPFINAFPNPAKDYIEFSYNLPVGAMEGALSITDLKGMVIHKQQLTAKYGQIAIDTRQWQQGAYLYLLSANGKMVANHKFVLVK